MSVYKMKVKSVFANKRFLKFLLQKLTCSMCLFRWLYYIAFLPFITLSKSFIHACSRSQCIINIRSAVDKSDRGDEAHEKDCVLTIVDLAGAEREKRTGNQVSFNSMLDILLIYSVVCGFWLLFTVEWLKYSWVMMLCYTIGSLKLEKILWTYSSFYWWWNELAYKFFQ